MEGEEGLTERQLYCWVVLMFGDVEDQKQFINAAIEFGKAATHAMMKQRGLVYSF